MSLEGLDYPISTALAYLFLCSYLVSRLFVACKLPAAVGTIVSGFLFSFFIQDDVLVIRDELQELAFFLVLLTAGFEITLRDLNVCFLAMGFLPVLAEMAGLTACAYFSMNYSFVEAAVLASSLCCLGDGLVIPKMKEFSQRFRGHVMPRLVFTCAPLEASFVLTIFGVLTPFANPKKGVETSTAVALLANVLIIVATLATGAALGITCGQFVMLRDKLSIFGRRIFTDTPVESYMMILCTALFAFGCGSLCSRTQQPWIPVGFASGSLVQKELLVIVTGSAVGAVVSEKVLHEVEAVMGGVWVFGQLVLFSMIGSKSDLSVFMILGDVVPLILAGLSCRFLGVVLSMSLVRTGLERPRETFWHDVLFCFLSSLPRATVQGALSGVPLRKHFFNSWRASSVRNFIALSGRLYIVLFSICGSVLLDIIGHRMLEASSASLDLIDSGAVRHISDHSAESWSNSSGSRVSQSALLPKEVPDYSPLLQFEMIKHRTVEFHQVIEDDSLELQSAEET